jgi:hypothetical protein
VPPVVFASIMTGKEEGARAQRGAQPLTKEDCKNAGRKWNDQSNVCGDRP